MSTTVTSIQQLADGNAAGTYLGRSDDLIGLYGKAPIAQQTAPTITLSVNPTASTSTLVASIQSIAVNALSTVNLVVLALSNLGIFI